MRSIERATKPRRNEGITKTNLICSLRVIFVPSFLRGSALRFLADAIESPNGLCYLRSGAGALRQEGFLPHERSIRLGHCKTRHGGRRCSFSIFSIVSTPTLRRRPSPI